MFEIVPELKVGLIVEVAGSAIRIELDGEISELTRTYGGRVYSVGQYGSMLKIHFGRRILLAYVRLLRMRSELEYELGHSSPSIANDARIIDADLFGEAIWSESEKCLEFHRGLKNYPLPGQQVYITTHDETGKIYEHVGTDKDQKLSPLISIGEYVGTNGAICYANADKLFGQHSAVLGSTGSGKSATVAAVIHSVLEHSANEGNSKNTCRPRIVIIDPHAEYVKAFGKRAIVYRAYDLLAGEESEAAQIRLPYWLLSGEEFRELVIAKTQEEATSENNIVYKALTHSRLVQKEMIEKAKRWAGAKADEKQPDDPRVTKTEYAKSVAEYDRDRPDPFSLEEFASYIKEELGVVIDSRTKEWSYMSTSSFKSHAAVLDKLTVLRRDPRLAFMMQDYVKGHPDLAEVIQQFVGETTKKDADIRIVDTSGLPNEIAGPVAAAIARLLFQYKVWQTRDERERDPVLLVCEEAHRYVPDQGRAEYESAQSAIRRIAKEGRKYGIGLMLVSQRPSDVERTVLSQCNSWIVMRLSNPADQEHVAKFLPDSLQTLVRLLPSLSRREAIFVGEAATVPARIIIRSLDVDKLPKSNDVNFLRSWHSPPVEVDAIRKVVNRWRRSEVQNTAPAADAKK